MSLQQYYVIFALVLFTSLSANPIDAEIPKESDALGNVVFVNVLYRHGDRTPVDPYPNDPYRDPKYWSTGWGQLTTLGMQQHYELGKWLRSRYRDLLVDDYTKDDIYIQSTDVDRTLMSALSHLSGMYPPSPNHQFEGSIAWQPIPIHTIPEHMDGVVAMKKHCPKYEEELAKVKNSPALKNFANKYQDVFTYLAEHTGSDIHDIRTAEYIHNTLFIEELKNLTLPEWTKKVYPEPLRTISKMSFLIPTFTPELSRLKAGPLVESMLSNLQSKINKAMQPDRKMFMYSAHDTTIANLLNTLKVLDPTCPPYAAMFLMELRQKGDDYFVALHYKNSSSDPLLLTLPGCTSFCPIAKFEALVHPLIPQNWEKECHLDIGFSTGDLNALTLSALIVCFVALVCLILMTCVQRRSYRDSYFRIQ